MEAAIRGALDKAGIPGAQARRRIYDSARAALDRSLERQGIADPERIDEHREKLELLITDIEAEWTPPSETETPPSPAAAPEVFASRDEAAAARPPVAAPPVQPAPTKPAQADPAPVHAAPLAPTEALPVEREPEAPVPEARKPDMRAPEVLGPEHDAPEDRRAPWNELEPKTGVPHQPAPAVTSVSAQPQGDARRKTAAGDAMLDFVPGAAGAATAAGAAPELNAERPPHIAAPADAKPQKPGKKVKVARARKEKRKRPIFASLFSAAVMLSFLGIGIWWLIESGALMSAEERDTGVPNPPPSLTRDDFAGGPQQLNPGAGFSGEWANVYTPGRDGTAEAGGNASAEVVEEAEGNVLRIASASADASGEVRVPLGPEVMQALAGRQSVLALTMRSATPEATQIYVRCEFSVLGDCGRRRFDVTYDTNDILFSLDYDRALAPNQGGFLIINSDVSGGAKGVDLIAVRIRPLT
tara:strand:- start:5238 stop:6653 length:1416 start_codon:yes stop_codon:yes gene_type:complete